MRYTFTIIFISLFSHFAIAQVFGTITNTTGHPVEGVYIFSPNIHDYAVSDVFGRFSFPEIKVGDTLFFRVLGYGDQIRRIEPKDFKDKILIQLTEKSYNLDQVHISSSIKSFNQISDIDLELDPVNSSQEILRKIPGLFIGQHAGGGKAEQIFLRGFDIDHGTDIAISTDGIPVNMVSHAHGQGYADLHFLIPETIENIDFDKGPYYADKGNFNTAGYIDFQTKDKLDESSVGLEAGLFNTYRAVALLDLLHSNKHNAYVASEYRYSDGPFESPQDFNRLNLMAKTNLKLKNNDQLSALFSQFNSKWSASGQIPERLVNDHTISRFGAVDNTEGGMTNRTNASLDYFKVFKSSTYLSNKIFYSRYAFDLYSNFTFFLNDLVNGDQIHQKETRNLLGWQSVFHHGFDLGQQDLQLQIGGGIRLDIVNDVELSHTKNLNEILERLAFGDVRENNYFSFMDAKIDFGKFLLNPSVRVDFFHFQYRDQLSQSSRLFAKNEAVAAPKLNLVFLPNRQWKFFLKSGYGFHSNDSRLLLKHDDNEFLPRAFGVDLGTTWKAKSNLWLHTALWYLNLEQEFVYVGDEAIIEPSGKTRRIGFDTGLRWQLSEFWFFNSSLNYAHARALDEEERYIPLVPDLTFTGTLSFQHPSGWSGSLGSRYMKKRPATSDFSIVAEGYFVTDMNVNFHLKSWSFGLSIENLFDTDWKETQFATLSKLRNEDTAVEEIHFTPGTPFFLNTMVRYHF